MYDVLSFFGGTGGLFFIGAVAALMIILWDWRVALAGLFCVQVGVASAAVSIEQLPGDWGVVMILVMGLACLILILSAQRMTRTTSLYQAGTWPLRTLLLLLLLGTWQLADVNIPLPEVEPRLAQLFGWLTLCTLVMLGLSDNPLFTTIALLIWLIPAQVMAALIVNAPALVALIGMLTLLLALAGSYLVLVEQASAEQSAPIVTDISFPSDLRVPVANLSSTQEPEPEDWLAWLQRQPWATPLVERTRHLGAFTRRWRS